MTAPDRLRALVAEATPGEWHPAYWPTPEPHWWIGVLPSDQFSSKMDAMVTGPMAREADARLIALAPQLAELLADMGEALWAIQTHTRFSEMPDGEQRIMQVASALARLKVLFPEEA